MVGLKSPICLRSRLSWVAERIQREILSILRGNRGVKLDDFDEIRAIFLSDLFLNPRPSV